MTVARTIVKLSIRQSRIYYGPLFDEGSRSHIYHGQIGSVGISEKNLGLMDRSDIVDGAFQDTYGRANLVM